MKKSPNIYKHVFNIFDYINYCLSYTSTGKKHAILFIAHAYSLYKYNRPLVNATFHASVYGPIILSVDRYQDFINKLGNSKLGDFTELSFDDINILETIIEHEEYMTIGRDSYWHSEAMVSEPFQDAFVSTNWEDNLITNEAISAYFNKDFFNRRLEEVSFFDMVNNNIDKLT
jgi:hypothetical protein